jgi:hypothetical protein
MAAQSIDRSINQSINQSSKQASKQASRKADELPYPPTQISPLEFHDSFFIL